MICGIDEAGRGPLAGPVCAAAAVLPPGFPVEILADSKKISAKQREEARRVIVEKAAAWGIGWAVHAEIDAINILQATLLAMRRAFDCLLKQNGLDGVWPEKLEQEKPFGRAFAGLVVPAGLDVVVDGNRLPALPIPCRAQVKADASVPEVMAASILAKTARDTIMDYYDQVYPQYGYGRHKGYPTKDHRKLILLHGPSPIQRISFRVSVTGTYSNECLRE